MDHGVRGGRDRQPVAHLENGKEFVAGVGQSWWEMRQERRVGNRWMRLVHLSICPLLSLLYPLSGLEVPSSPQEMACHL